MQKKAHHTNLILSSPCHCFFEPLDWWKARAPYTSHAKVLLMMLLEVVVLMNDFCVGNKLRAANFILGDYFGRRVKFHLKNTIIVELIKIFLPYGISFIL